MEPKLEIRDTETNALFNAYVTGTHSIPQHRRRYEPMYASWLLIDYLLTSFLQTNQIIMEVEVLVISREVLHSVRAVVLGEEWVLYHKVDTFVHPNCRRARLPSL